MKIAFVFLNSDLFRHFEVVVRKASACGHEIDLVIHADPGNSPNPFGRALINYLHDPVAGKLHPMLIRRDRWIRKISLIRELINYSIYYKSQHPSISLKNRWKKYITPKIWQIVGNPVVGKILSFALVNKVLRQFEKFVPPDKQILNWLETTCPDVLFASPYITAGSLEVEYVKAAKRLKIPTIVAVASWDNLTTKGTFQVVPDWTFLWNQALKDEAIEIHDLPKNKIFITGAPTFDYWFEMRPALDRDSMCSKMGLNPNNPFIVYLCSSRGMIEDEVKFVLELEEEMLTNSATKHLTLLVRPHPLNMIKWESLLPSQIKVWPINGEFTDTQDARMDYFQTIYYCLATIGINTSAMIETTILNKPCISIIDQRYEASQKGMGHFRHMVNGNFLYLTNTYQAAVEILEDLLVGIDPRSEARRQFMESFIRPKGLKQSASSIMMDAIEAVGNGLEPR